MPTLRINVPVWLYLEQAHFLRARAGENLRREREWLAVQRESMGLKINEPSPPGLRVALLELRPVEWPGESHMVESAMRERLQQSPLAGPWASLTEEERSVAGLSGRKIGSAQQDFDTLLSFDLDSGLVESARLAAHRISEPVVAALIRENLVGRGASRSKDSVARKIELQAEIYTLGRIIRESIDLIRTP